jgi:hypothetical protein
LSIKKSEKKIAPESEMAYDCLFPIMSIHPVFLPSGLLWKSVGI